MAVGMRTTEREVEMTDGDNLFDAAIFQPPLGYVDIIEARECVNADWFICYPLRSGGVHRILVDLGGGAVQRIQDLGLQGLNGAADGGRADRGGSGGAGSEGPCARPWCSGAEKPGL